MRSIIVVIFLSVCFAAYVDYQDVEDEGKDDAEFDDHYDVENTEDIITTTFITTLDETGGIRNRIRRFGEQSSGARTLSLDEIQDVKGALKVLLAGHQLDRLTTTGTETITITNKNSYETAMRDLTSFTKVIDSVDRTKFYEDLIEEIISNAKKQGKLVPTTARKTETTIFETKTDMTTDKVYEESTIHPTRSDVKTETTSTSKKSTTGNSGQRTNTFVTTQRAQGISNITKTLPKKTQSISTRDPDSKRPISFNRKSFPNPNKKNFPDWIKNFPTDIPEAFESSPIHETAKFTFETVENEEIEFQTFKEGSKTGSSESGTEKGDKYKGPVTSNTEKIEKESISAVNKMADSDHDLAHEVANLFAFDHPITLRRRKWSTRPKWRKDDGEVDDMIMMPDEDSEEEDWDEEKFTTTTPTTTTVSKRTTLALADPHYYPYPYNSQLFPNTTTTNATTIWRTRRRKTTTTLATTTVPPHVDIPRLLAIVQDLTSDFESNLTEMLNETLQRYNIPTCPPIGWRGPVFYDLANAPVVAKCFVCGLKETAIPQESICGDAFASDFLPLVPIDPQARSNLVRFRKYCRYLDVHNYYENETEPRSVFGRFTGGCSVRFIDLSNTFTQRACRNKRRAMQGKHFASKRMAKLEMALNEVDNGCIISPMASLVPMSRGVSLYARFHACVCTGSWCNLTTTNQPWIPYIAMLVCWTIMIFERRVDWF